MTTHQNAPQATVNVSLAEYSALCKIAVNGSYFVEAAGSLPFMKYSGKCYEEWAALKDALAALNTLRKGEAK